ncbi:hypothetical protein ABID21_003617 [Pseudorhizobium tarimense]|uniref:SPOR domain-containing protein n=1 Tax=Pseudorhizobium tarimense TaxID=1079109 RepID=A0ABV2HAN9_9HYPH|nr:SPOR domain-containing protein [Pseudorhizobium tarimense]MCJ8520507.1 SPOR domain-containing protein [Pseudorhizobium tarimense]
MADDNLARNRDDAPDFFADGDPLAELARIVGYDERLVPKPPAAERREPAFNLEDELLQEFERYEAPRPHQSEHDALVVADLTPEPHEPALQAPVDAPEVSAYAEEPIFADETFFPSSPRVDEQPTFMVDPAEVQVAQAVELEVSVSEDLAQWAPEPDLADAEVGSVTSFEQEDVAPAEEFAPAADAAPSLDLSDELELAIGSGEAPTFGAAPRGDRKPIYTPGFRMPLANFHPVNEEPRAAQPRQEPPARVEPELAAPVVDVAPVVSPLDVATPAEAIEPTTELEAASPIDQSWEESASLELADADLDAPTAGRVEPARPMISEPRFDLPSKLKEEPFDSGVSRLPSKLAVKPAAPVEPVLDDDFDLAMDDLELDLTDILADDDLASFAEPAPAPAAVVERAPAPVAAAPAPAAPTRVTASWSPIARVVPTPAVAPAPLVALAPAPVAAPAQPQTVFAASPSAPRQAERAAAEVAADQGSSLAFDPALIAETDEQPEPVVDLDVPELHVEDQEPVPEFRTDYDYDIDAELASLLQPAVAEAADQSETVEKAAPEQFQQQSAPLAAHPSADLDLDDFERALEEDFRRSLTAPLPPQAEYEQAAGRSFAGFTEGSRRSIAAFAVPLAVAGVVVAGGSIAYALFGGENSSVGSSGEPIVIAADTDPVKVLPKDPGGKTVPNQDKAVYDRVAGQVPEAPKQEALISTSEEPVDVVQKTLMTDQLPLEGEETADAADAMSGEAYREDRLMPDSEQTATPAGSTQQPVAIMPRRVKTMIVRPDGTLVEQEVAAAPAPNLPEAMPTGAQKVPAASVKSVELASIPDAQPTAAPEAPVGIVPVSADASATVSDTIAGLDGAEPEAVDEQPAVAAPVPTARPAQQPANVVASVSDQGNLQVAPAAPVAAPAAAAPVAQTQVASVSPGDYVIQIASLPTAADAEKSYKNLSAKFASVIGGRGVDIREAEIAGKGTFYRVRIPAGSKADAVALCEKYRAAGGSCLVAK